MFAYAEFKVLSVREKKKENEKLRKEWAANDSLKMVSTKIETIFTFSWKDLMIKNSFSSLYFRKDKCLREIRGIWI